MFAKVVLLFSIYSYQYTALVSCMVYMVSKMAGCRISVSIEFLLLTIEGDKMNVRRLVTFTNTVWGR